MRFTRWLAAQNVELTDAQQSLAKRVENSSSQFATIALLTGPGACRNRLLLNLWLTWQRSEREHTQPLTQPEPGTVP